MNYWWILHLISNQVSIFNTLKASTCNENQTKLLLKKYGVLTPAHKIIRSHSNKIDEELVDIWNRLHHPLIIKPNKGGSSLGIRLAKDFNALKNIVYVLTSEGHDVLIEEYIKGREVSVPVIEDMRGESLYTPIPLEVRHGAEFFDEKVKKDIKYQLEPMVNFNDTEKKLVQKLAKHIHKSLNLKHYSVSDFIVSKKGIYFIETNSLPGLTENSILVRSLEESGVSMKYFLTHIIEKIK